MSDLSIYLSNLFIPIHSSQEMIADVFPGLILYQLLIDLHICPSFCMLSCVLICVYAHSTVYIVCVCLRGGQSCVFYLYALQFLPQAHSHLPQRSYMTGLWVKGEAGSHVTICYIKSEDRSTHIPGHG